MVFGQFFQSPVNFRLTNDYELSIRQGIDHVVTAAVLSLEWEGITFAGVTLSNQERSDLSIL